MAFKEPPDKYARLTENATVVGELLADLVDQGLDLSQPRLYILDGGKALRPAVKKHAGESAVIQRCQVHKRRNVLDHLTDEQKPAVAKKLNAALCPGRLCRGKGSTECSASRTDGSQSERGAEHGRRDGRNADCASPSPAALQQRKTMASTNVIESAFSIVEQVCKNVKRWHGGDQRERWGALGLLVAEKQFRRVTGYKQIPVLIRELEALTPSNSAVAKRKKVS